ncbi:MAG: glycerol-3-phosphate dehydrogenase/oxidase [Actinomycetota bacterium]|nr:glycerol-3-phosphate dehydrogenase/oxidase [Actinomycetota bacterium]
MQKTREEVLENLKSKSYDILVIGGGVTGAAIARDTVMRGFTCACIDKGDWASGTSSRSSKLIHGGLRYLEMFEFHLVFEACRERKILLEIAPHLVYPQPFTYPVYKGDKNGLFMIWAGMWLYDILALFRNVENHKMYLKEKALELEEGLDEERLKGAGVFYDCSTDDARLTLSFVLSAMDNGADCANYLKAIALLKERGQIRGARVRDTIEGKEFDIEAKVVINATGPWDDETCSLDEPGSPSKLTLTKGAHFIVPRGRLRTRNALPILSPTDNRMMFIIPRGNFTLVGTTDTYYEGDLEKPHATREDVEYMLEATNHSLPKANLDKADIISTYAGLRPLAMQEGGEDVAESKVSREHRIYEGRSGLFTIAGGKLTTARSMAEEMVDLASEKLTRNFGIKAKRPCLTDKTPVLGTPDLDTEARVRALSRHLKLDDAVLGNLFKQGTAALGVLSLVEENPNLGEPIVPGIGYLKAQVTFAARQEMAKSLEDFMIRRSEIFYTATDQGLAAVPVVASILARELGWDEVEKKRQIEKYKDTVAISRLYATE